MAPQKRNSSGTPDPNRDKTTGRFVAGNRANPGGRPALPVSAKDRLVSMLPNALDTLQQLINDESAKPEVRIRAAEIVLDRNLGRAVTPIMAEVVSDKKDMTLSEMIAAAKDLFSTEEKNE